MLGSASGMITSLKNNNRRKKKVSVFKRMKNYGPVKYKKGSIDKKASRALLKQIAEKVKRQQRQESSIIYTIIGMGIILFIWLVS